jgi:hypothetical protein
MSDLKIEVTRTTFCVTLSIKQLKKLIKWNRDLDYITCSHFEKLGALEIDFDAMCGPYFEFTVGDLSFKEPILKELERIIN